MSIKAKDSKGKKSPPRGGTSLLKRNGKNADAPKKSVEVQRKAGRPSKYKPELIEEIGERLSVGEPLAAICRDDHMPAYRTVKDWMDADERISADIARARESGEDYLAAECLAIANTPQVGERIKITDEGTEITREDMLGHRKLQIETRLKLLAKWNPKKWGDKIEVDNKGKVKHTITFRRG